MKGSRSGLVLENRFELGELLGQGAMGEIYEARDLSIDKTVAVKVLSPVISPSWDGVERLEREVKNIARIHDPHVVDVSHRGRDEKGLPYYVMERLYGRALSDILKERGRFAPADATRVVRDILSGLGAIHRAGIVHRDMKPHNVMLVQWGETSDYVKIVDFGIAREVRQTLAELTRPGYIAGSEHYIAPEIVMNATPPPPHPRMDVYAVGVILYRMLSGKSPWEGRTSLNEIALAMASVGPPDLGELCPDVPASLVSIVKRAMAVNPEERYQSADEFARVLGSGSPAGVSPPDEHVELQSGTIVDGTYRIVEEIGKGGMGTVFLARDESLDRDCALKVLLPQYAADADLRLRFLRDGKLTAMVENPFIVRVYRASEWHGHAYIAMELHRGQTLWERWPTMNWPTQLEVIRQIGSALDAIHAHRVFHRDVTPENIVVDDHGNSKLIDFGIARNASSDLTRSSASYRVGRLGYISPEQLASPKRVTAASDQWSLAAIVYEALVGIGPYMDGQPADGFEADVYANRLTSGKPPAPVRSFNNTVSSALDDAVLQALSFEPNARFPSVSAFAQALSGASRKTVQLAPREADGSPRAAATIAGHVRGRRLPQSRRRWAFLIAAGAAAIITTAVVGLRPHGRAAEPVSSSTPPKSESPREAKSTITLRANVEGATVLVDGQRLPLPRKIEGKPGDKRSLIVEKTNYAPLPVELEFTASATTRDVQLVESGDSDVKMAREAARKGAPKTAVAGSPRRSSASVKPKPSVRRDFHEVPPDDNP